MIIFLSGVEAHKQLLLAAALYAVAGLFGSADHTNAASSAPMADPRAAVQVYAGADESFALVESVADGSSLTPIAEMIGGGGLKWFMVKTKNGNVGWIKAGDNRGTARINEHFRALPKDAALVVPASSTAASTATSTLAGAITIPVRIERAKVIVPVTLASGYSSATGNLVVDTGAGQTMISNRLARELRLLSVDTQTRGGIGGSYITNVGQIESIKVGGAEVKNLRISINDGSNAFGGEGLLGFDFLGRFNMSVDSERKVMVLTPRNPEQAKGQ